MVETRQLKWRQPETAEHGVKHVQALIQRRQAHQVIEPTPLRGVAADRDLAAAAAHVQRRIPGAAHRLALDGLPMDFPGVQVRLDPPCRTPIRAIRMPLGYP